MTSVPNRLSACHRHPTASITAFCSFCLRERLAGFHSSPTSSDSPSPDHRRSCEIQVHNSLSNLIYLADERKDLNQKPENSVFQFMKAEQADNDEVDRETMTIKELIDLESQIRKKNVIMTDLRSFRNAVNALGEKLVKWKWKHTLKKNRNGNSIGIEDYGLRRRSCDADRTFSMEARRGSVDWPRCLIGRAFSCSCQCPCSKVSPMVSVMEDANDNCNVHFDTDGDGSNCHRRESMAEIVEELKPNSSGVCVTGSSSASPFDESLRQNLVRSYSLSYRITMADLVNGVGDSGQRRGRQEFMFYLAGLKNYKRSKSANSRTSI